MKLVRDEKYLYSTSQKQVQLRYLQFATERYLFEVEKILYQNPNNPTSRILEIYAMRPGKLIYLYQQELIFVHELDDLNVNIYEIN